MITIIMWISILLLSSIFLTGSLTDPLWDHLSLNNTKGSPRRVSKFLNLFSVVRCVVPISSKQKQKPGRNGKCWL